MQLISTFYSPPGFDMAGSRSFQPCYRLHQKFIAPGKHTCGAHTTHILSLFPSLVFCPLSSFSLVLSLDFCPAFLPCHVSFTCSPFHACFFFFFSRSFSSLYHPLCHCGNFLPSWQACTPLSSPSLRLSLLSPFDTVNKQVEVAVIVDASAELPGNE